MSEVVLPRIPSKSTEPVLVEGAADLRSVSLNASASAPELRRVAGGELGHSVGEEEGGKARANNGQAASWLPALRPLTGCAGLGKVNTFDAALAVSAARSLGVLSRQLGDASVTSKATSGRASGVSSVMPTSRSCRSLQWNAGLLPSASEPTLSVAKRGGRGGQGPLRAGALSPPVLFQNDLAGLSLGHLSNGEQVGLHRQGPRASANGSPLASAALLLGGFDREHFSKASERLDQALADLRTGLDTFDPRLGPRGGGGASSPEGHQQGRRGDHGSNEEAADSRRERFEAYKMARKIEPEVPPLSRHLDQEELPPKTPPDQAMVLRNASESVLREYSLEAKRARLQARKEFRLERSQAVTHTHEALLQENTDRYNSVLQEKSKRAQACNTEKKTGSNRNPAKLTSFAQNWLQAAALGAFAVRCRGALHVTQQKETQRHSLLMEPEGRPSVQEEVGPKLAATLFLAYSVLQTKRMVRAKRAQATIMANSLTAWRHGGPILVGVRRTAHHIRTLQRWWRQRSRILKQMREHVSRRWEALEKAELLKEQQRRYAEAEGPSKKTSKHSAHRKKVTFLSSEDYAQLWSVPAEARDKFIQNELRARRYLLLTELALWEEDCEQWRNKMAAFAENDSIVKSVTEGHDADPIPPTLFQWTPVRPSYMPAAHPTFEGWCPDSCCGRKGDAEILDMWRRCRQARQRGIAGGWTLIPQKSQAMSTASSPVNRQGSRRHQPASAMSSLDDQFPDVAEADLREFLVDPDEMPCLAEGAELPAIPSPC